MTKQKKTNKRCFVICPNPSVDILASIAAIRANASNRIQQEKRFPGGKGIHVALALAELEIPTTLIGFWGNKNGDWLKESCKAYQPNLEVVGPQVEGWNRSCYTFQSDAEWQDTEILGTGPTMKEAHFEELITLLEARKNEIESIAICGSWPQGALAEYNQKLVELGNSLGVPVFLDCTGVQLKNALEAHPFCVHLNRSEVTEYFEKDFELAKNELAELCEMAAVTDGSKGLFLYKKEDEMHAVVKIEDVKSTVGSGDCLMAGIIAGCYLDFSFQDIAKMGAACGAANCLNENLGMLEKEEADKLFARTKSKLLSTT